MDSFAVYANPVGAMLTAAEIALYSQHSRRRWRLYMLCMPAGMLDEVAKCQDVKLASQTLHMLCERAQNLGT